MHAVSAQQLNLAFSVLRIPQRHNVNGKCYDPFLANEPKAGLKSRFRWRAASLNMLPISIHKASIGKRPTVTGYSWTAVLEVAQPACS